MYRILKEWSGDLPSYDIEIILFILPIHVKRGLLSEGWSFCHLYA